jgi:hypothetical protein
MSDPAHIKLLQAVARHFFGDPNQRLSKKGELRFGTHGSLSVDLAKGAWFDHEANEGGGPLDLIMRETGISEPREAYAWAEREGYWINGRARDPDPAPKPKPRREPAAIYDYVSEGGELLSQVVRYEPKAFRQRRPDGNGWIWNIEGVRRVPYRLPELLESLGNEQIIIAEGEKDVDNLRRLGAPATCNLGGAGKWDAELNQYFAKANVVIIADNDPQAKHKRTGQPLTHKDGRPRFPGWDHAVDIAQHLAEVADSVRLIDLKKVWPQCPDKGDASDWIAAGLTIEALYRIAEDMPIWDGNVVREIEPPKSEPPLLISQTKFLEGFIPPDYLVDGIFQRRFIYALTGVTGGGKTAIALLLARVVGSLDAASFGGHAVEKGKVIYFVGENPDDIRARIIAANALRSDDSSTDRIHYVVGIFNIEQIRARVAREAEALGGVDLVLIDTSAAYFLGDEELSNTQMGAHARMLRSLTTLPGGPCVVALCHPIKHVTDPSQLLPRGGGAFLNEVDGNLTAWKRDEDIIELHHTGKLRGPGFEPVSFKLEKFTTLKLVDSKGRMLPTVRAVSISESEEAERARAVRGDEDLLLLALLENSGRSQRDLARACGFLLPNGDPYQSKVRRLCHALRSARLVKPGRGGQWALTDEGSKAAKKLKDDEIERVIEDRGGVTSAKPFTSAVGKRCDKGIPCIHCHVADGNVHKIKDGRLRKGQGHYEALHKGCAEDFYTGKPSPESAPKQAEPVLDFEAKNALNHG